MSLDLDLLDIREDLETLVKDLKREARKRPKGGREISLVVTNMEEASMWAGKALEERGYYDK